MGWERFVSRWWKTKRFGRLSVAHIFVSTISARTREKTLFELALKDQCLLSKQQRTSAWYIIYSTQTKIKSIFLFFLSVYNKTLWSSFKYMLWRMKDVSGEILFISHALSHERGRQETCDSFELPKPYIDFVSNQVNWKSVSLVHSVFDLIWKCTGLCEDDQSTMNTVHDCSLNIRARITIHDYITALQNTKLDTCFLRQQAKVYCNMLFFFYVQSTFQLVE